jgi:broad specificity phosphatase PhoE
MIFAKTIWLVRHGESIGNVARHEAENCKALKIETPHREPDVELSPLGVQQSKNLGKWFADQMVKPTIIYTSPYTRAQETTQLLSESAGFHHNEILFKTDERLREREFGIFDCLTKEGAMMKYPELCGLRERWGKFYFRPPGGESWADVVFRLRSFIETDLSKLHRKNILIITHEVVIRCFRYILEDLTEAEILAIDAVSDVENGAITGYEFDSEQNKLMLKLDNYLPNIDLG